jgi:uncharacterized protein (DUF1501 family)
MTTRRQFLQQSALVSLSPLLPTFLSRSVTAADAKKDDRVLVVIQLDGGNDGLNTVIPYADENYARLRSALRIDTKEIIKLNDTVGLHPALKAAADLFNDNRLAIVQGVGYPNPNRSHFESMAIWHHARLAADGHDGNGWLGRAAESLQPRGTSVPDSIFIGAEVVPVALRGRRANALSLQNESDLQLTAPVGWAVSTTTSSDITAFVQQSVTQSFDAARQFRESNQFQSSSTSDYPDTKLAHKLQLVSKLLKLGGQTRIYYVSQSGYDTHAAQLYPHDRLLREFAGALKAFLNDLQAAKLDDRVVVLAFSEFGRRAAENGSAGTDHGAAGPVFLAGPQVNSGLIGAHPSLTDLDEGDLKMSVDFRQIYAAILTNWLRVDHTSIFTETVEPIAILS